MTMQEINWTPVLETDMPLNVMLNVLPTKGNLVYEYNPFRNYRLTKDKYWYDGKYYTLEELEKDCGITLNNDNTSWNNVPKTTTDPILYEKGQLVDFITDEFKFSLDHPVHIIPLHSYDGSVNLIINDGLNKPRLINSRFSATGKNTYEIIDRKGSNDTNIYDLGELFDIDTSLYKIVDKIPKILFLGVSIGGNLSVGNYHFYFKLVDSDGNETDFIGESGLVSVFIGKSSYNSVYTGTKNENSAKLVEFYVSNIDSAYDYIKVYYSRSTAEAGMNMITEYKRINKKYPKGTTKLVITGFEETEDITVSDLNNHFNIVDAVQTSAVCLNMLFMGNVKRPDIPYEELQDLSLRILPFLGTEEYDPEIDLEYSSGNPQNSYINPNFIYDKTGYWPNELYRFGIVYILPNGQLTPVFNIRGALDIGTIEKGFTNIPITEEINGETERVFVQYNNKNFYLNDSHNNFKSINNNSDVLIDCNDCYNYENVKGVCSFAFNKPTHNNSNPEIYYVRFYIPEKLKTYLKKYVKGYFFVRQTRIPLILALGITIGIDNESGTPTIPTRGGVLERLEDTLEKSHVETEDIRSINYISEGFLKRYTFTFKKKSSSLWGKIGKIMGVAALVVGAAAAALYTGGASFMFVGALGNITGAIAGAVPAAVGVLGAAIATGAVAGAAGAVTGAVITGVLASSQELGLAVSRIGAKKRLNGRATVAPDGYKIVETEDSRTLVEDFEERIIIKDPTKNKVNAIICPDYTVNQAYYNLIFTGNEHYITTDYRLSSVIDAESKECFFTNNYRHFYIDNYGHYTSNRNKIYAKIIGVPDSVSSVGIDNKIFRSKAGEAEEAWRYKNIGSNVTATSGSELQKINTDIVRGNYSPYLAFTNNSIGPARIVNIYIPGYDFANLLEYIDIRMTDNSTYYAITDRMGINDFESRLLGDLRDNDEWVHAYRGDCYICLYTLRINRNFNDPSAPYNDQIVDKNTWRNNYDPDNTEKYELINLGDVNAVPLGMWITFLLRSSNNLNIRTLDGSNVDESAMIGHPRGYFPIHPMSTEGTYKHSESLIYNKGFTKSLSERWNFELPDVPYIKNWFGTRIMYSDIHINDGFKNGFRIFRGTHYRDYTREYGEIIKLVSLESSLLCVFEHGVALIPVNERAVAGQGTGGNVYINTSNVLPENPKIISDMFGSQWPESILKVPGRTGDAPLYVYGVDTVAKKIWRTDGNSIECISDFKVQEFLNNNITLGERELTPKIGIRNVKTHYNAFKRDVMFTFYDNTYGFEEKVWNLCWNELLQKFITFYSWVPSYMENINNIPFSFNRDTSKWIAKLGTSHSDNSFADGITLNNVIVGEQNKDLYIKYIKKDGTEGTYKYTLEINDDKFVGALSLSNRVLPDDSLFYTIKYDLVRDTYGNWKKFEIPKDPIAEIPIPDAKFSLSISIYGLFLKEGYTKKDLYSELYYRNKEGHSYADNDNDCVIIKYNEKGKPVRLLTNDEILNLELPMFKSKENLTDEDILSMPIYKDITGKRVNLPREEMLNPDKIVTLLNIKATIQIQDSDENVKLGDDYYNMKAGYAQGTSLIDAGYYESVVAIAPRWNLQFLSTDFWKHGQAGLIDIADDIYPTYWYGKQHPFEFECVVVNDPSVHKIFDNLELVANKAKPESFHYEIIGECYDFAKDKPNMYFRLEARKHIWLYNGADILYDKNYLKTNTKWNIKSADLIHLYYDRQDSINEIEDYYHKLGTQVINNRQFNFNHLSGAEIVYYPNRLEYRIWNHTLAVDIDNDFSKVTSIDSGCRGLIAGNMSYLEDKWRVTINPILIVYKNEYNWELKGWTKPPVPIYNSPIPNTVITGDIPKELDCSDIDLKTWLITDASNRKELDLKDKFIKVRIRYSGEELAVIDFLNTIYRISYA